MTGAKSIQLTVNAHFYWLKNFNVKMTTPDDIMSDEIMANQ